MRDVPLYTKTYEGGKVGKSTSVIVLSSLTPCLLYSSTCFLFGMTITPEIDIESTQLPIGFHRDPADLIIVATARVYDCQLVTSDSQIIEYQHVETIH